MKKIKVLIADDEEMLQEIYLMTLELEFDCESVCVANGNEAIEALKTQGPFDLIISDYRMPEANGGKVYLYNKTLHNTPFFLFSGGFLQDYCEFSDFYQINSKNHFFPKPFHDEDLLTAARKLEIQSDNAVENNAQYIKVNLRHYLEYTSSSAEVYLKLHDNKFTKIIDANQNDAPEKDLLKHYLDKGVQCIFIERRQFDSLMRDFFEYHQQKLLNERKKETVIDIGGMPFKICFEGLNEIGISQVAIERTNEVMGQTIASILADEENRERFKSYCCLQGFAIGHSLLIMYIAAGICHETGLHFLNTMKKICTAAFYHDFSLFENDAFDDALSLEEATQRDSLFNHPAFSAGLLPKNMEVFDDIEKIILEHHEKPNGRGYPKNLNSHTIAPLSCLFILSQEITFNLIRNDFDMERLKDFLRNAQPDYSEGNFGKFYKVCEAIFELNT